LFAIATFVPTVGVFFSGALGTLSSGNADGDSDAETCEKTRERTPLWLEFTNII